MHSLFQLGKVNLFAERNRQPNHFLHLPGVPLRYTPSGEKYVKLYLNPMKNPNWRNITGPVFPWVKTLNEIMQGFEIPLLEGPLVYIASDYSGRYRGSEYFVITMLMADLYNSKTWEKYRREIRVGLLRDNRRMSYKALNDKRRKKALKPFLNAAGFIHGLLATFVIHNSISHIVTHSDFLVDWYDRLGLKGNWTDKQFEKMLRVANFVSILIGAMGKAGQNIYWISDEDDIFANETKQHDVALMMSRLGNLYIKHDPGELGVGTSKIDPGDRAEEDLVAVADLTAGAIADIVNNLSKNPNWFVGNHVAIASGLKAKTEVIRDWLSASKKELKKASIIFDRSDTSDFSMRSFDLRESQILI